MTAKYFNVKELAKYLNISESTIRLKVFKKTIPYKKMGGSIRFCKDEINQYIEKCSIKGVSDE
jgi:excisionase family DNA binding protein